MSRSLPAFSAVATVAAVALGGLPAAAGAVTATVGRATLDPSGTSSTCSPGASSCVEEFAQLGLPAGDGAATAPADGTVTAWRAIGSRTGAESVVCLVVLRPAGNGQYTQAATTNCTAVASPHLDGSANTLDGGNNPPLAVQAGDVVAAQVRSANDGSVSTGSIAYAAASGASWGNFPQFFSSAQSPTATGTDREYMINADEQLAVPVVTSVSPAQGDGGGGTTVTISGQHLANASNVSFGTAAANITGDTNTTITATAPAHGPGTVDVTVTAPGGTSAASSADQFTYPNPPAPAITGISPTRGSAAGGTAVTILGSHLDGATQVLFGSARAVSFSGDNVHIVAVAPMHAAGPVDVTVVTPAGTSKAVAADRFSFVVPADTTAPVLRGFALTPATFVAANFGGSIASVVGTRVIYRLSEAARVTMTFQRVLSGHRRGGRCRSGGHGTRCTLLTTLRGRVVRVSPRGRDAFRFLGRVAGRRLANGRYRLTVAARDRAGNRSRPVHARFRIVG